MTAWRVVFMGTPDFATGTLQALLDGPDTVVAVFTQPDKPVGRGMKMQKTPVKQLAEQHGIPVYQPNRLREAEAVTALRALRPDVVVVVAYGQILSREVLEIPTHGCINVHASLLPRWRGAAPIQRAILAGDAQSGVTIMAMEEGLDTGPMYSTVVQSIDNHTTGGQLHDQLMAAGGGLLVETLARIKHEGLTPQIQPEQGVTYAAKLKKEEGLVDWSQPAIQIQRAVQAFDPWPCAFTLWQGKPLKLFAASVVVGHGTPGEVIEVEKDGFVVACGDGALRVAQVQAAGKKRMSSGEWLRGHGVKQGERLGEG
ncbi:methionyl-tRNA formyltransferase [Magnetococcus marinus MC-1]|uniref:Methionyl-tRNA formyltransferase n=1 Tax=Magnetococcus marinus (strain ATCC BAA-1437 / JCM 17883 / MC-1) TaxID=156889 RepID=FMT_MAGMM|nr:methionyl-tRNA formyltransferase [Magnetococcus marinus]A0L3X7.1 RecName: Full=Methionyl-tRNA formyltransferase [Magnetococcus marinus MC-1]ABK42670.1 methionyl-tRNA formyltransferase [Magnetococcus marinus MC-1]